MKKIDKIIIGIMLIAIMLLNIGYAAIQNVTLNINGTATAEAPISLTKVTNANIGDYIDLGNNIVRTESTSDDWRIFYVEGNTVYVILSECLPISYVPVGIGLITEGNLPVSVWSDSRINLMYGLNNTIAWNSLANGIKGAIVNGSPTYKLFANSYEMSVGTNFLDADNSFSNISADLQNLYCVADTQMLNGYYLMEIDDTTEDRMCVVNWGQLNYAHYATQMYGIRPVVALPITTEAYLVNGIWKIL